MATVNSSAAVLEAGDLTSSDELVKGICPVCLSEFCDPRLLDCLHSVCRSCLEAMAVTGGDQLQCPLCRTTSRLPEGGVTALPGDLTVPVSSENADECLLCDSSSRSSSEQGPQFWCSECSVVICSSHLVLHMSTDGSHNIQNCDASSRRTRSGTDASHARVRHDCSKHGKRLEYFCVSCDTCICPDCGFLGSHSGHKPIVNVKDVVAERKELISINVAKLVDEMERLGQGAKAVDDVISRLTVRADEVRGEIRNAGDQAKQAIDDQVCRLLQEVQDVEDSRTKSLDNQRQELTRRLQNIEGAVLFSNRLAERGGDGIEVMPSLLALQKRASNMSMRMAEVSDKPKQHAHLVFMAANTQVLDGAVGEVLPCRGSARHSVVRGESTQYVGPNEATTFVLQINDNQIQAVTHEGDIVNAKVVGGEAARQACKVGVEVTGFGLHSIIVMPEEEGEFSVEVFVNGAKMAQRLTVVSLRRFQFDPDECHIDIQLENELRTATRLPVKTAHTTVLGKHGMSAGRHSWKLRLGGSVGGMCLGIAPKPFQRSENDHAQAIYWSNNTYQHFFGKSSVHSAFGSFQVGETLLFELDCDARVLTITTQAGKKDTIRGLPRNREFFPYVGLYRHGSSVTFVQ